ncbi:hypothetical protein ANCDUO_11557 [Ancylostoma duodenale]|uniref:Uncharacterized protein n=1 Tax=Ancylostoma duodenale TaxID=51022 RepID=A0A0C2CNE2_9BILA|nr:hypothetical protein ANCDUO_11557 [Ancylostoma duodenale]
MVSDLPLDPKKPSLAAAYARARALPADPTQLILPSCPSHS